MRVVIQIMALSRWWFHSLIVMKRKKHKIHSNAGRLVCILVEKGGRFVWMPSIFSVEEKQEEMEELEIGQQLGRFEKLTVEFWRLSATEKSNVF